MDKLKEEVITHLLGLLKKWLPHPKSYLLLLVTVLLSASLFVYPEKALELVQKKPTPEIISDLKWIISPWLLFLGVLVAHFQTVAYLHSQITKEKFDINNYGLHEFPTTARAYKLKLKQNNQNTEPTQYLCEYCAANNYESPLQPVGFNRGVSFFLKCHKCGLIIPIKTMSNALEQLIRSKIT